MRRVVAIYGPPGAGKSTHAATLGLRVYDLDEWAGTDAQFRAELARVAQDPEAQAAVIRCSPYTGVAQLCGATEQVVITTPLRECISRIHRRRRTTPSISQQVAAAQAWWYEYEQHDRTLPPLAVEPKRRAL